MVGDGEDTNCDGVDGVDLDGDGIASADSLGTDCDDEDPTINPAAEDGEWQVEALPDTTFGGGQDIALDSSGDVHLAYLVAPSEKRLLNHAVMRAGAWTSETVDRDFPNGPSLAISSDDVVHIAYHARGELRVAHFDGQWSRDVVDTQGDPGSYNSMAVDDAGVLHVGYFAGGTPGELRYGTNDGGAWTSEVVGPAKSGAISLALGSRGEVFVAHLLDGRLMLETNASDEWSSQEVAATGCSTEYPSVAVDSYENVHLVYRDCDRDALVHSMIEENPRVDETISAGGEAASVWPDSEGAIHVVFWLQGADRFGYGVWSNGSWGLGGFPGTVSLSAVAVGHGAEVHVMASDYSSNGLRRVHRIPDGVDSDCDGVDY